MQILENALSLGRRALNEHESKTLIASFGVPVVSERVAKDMAEAVAVSEATGFPVVVKALGSTLLHKTERGLVKVNLSSSEAVRDAAAAMAAEAGAELEGFLVQPFIQGKRELVAGLFRDKQFGPVVMLGLGGIFTEAISDVTFRIAPLTEADAREMIGEIKAQRFLEAFRGEAAVDRDALVKTLMGLSRLAMDHPEISEIDINPLLISANGGVCAVDALVVLNPAIETQKYLPAIDSNALGSLFYPHSIAFVGASAAFGKWGHSLFTITAGRGYKGEIYLVNPKGGTIANRPVYRTVGDIPGKVDLAVVTVPAAAVMELIPQFKAKGITNMLLITSGFSEVGAAGKVLEKQLVETAAQNGIILVGPNTMGICNPHIHLYCTGSHVMPEPGKTAVVAQSGNMGTQLLAFAEQQGIGIRAFCGSGNEAMVTIEDFVDAFEKDDVTQTVMLYVESVKNGRRFLDGCRRVGRKKPIVLMKGGRSEAGNKAAASHTGAMSTDIRIFDAVCKQAGIVKVERSMDLLDLSAAFSSLPLPKGNRAAIMTLGGGWGVVTADLCSEYHIEVPELSQELNDIINTILPPYWSHANPVDIVGENDMSIPMKIMEILMKWDGCDAVINLGIMGRRILANRVAESISLSDPTYSPEFLAEVRDALIKFESEYVTHIVRLMETCEKPVFGVSLLKDSQDKTVYSADDGRYKAVFYESPERAVKAFSRMVEYRRFLER
jgi:acyl-CoA synthetase (NDP forming)